VRMMEELNNLKENLSKGELADFVFTEKMRKNVLEQTSGRSANRKKQGLKLSDAVPRTLSAAAVLLFSAGIYYIVGSGLQEPVTPSQNPGRNSDSDVILPQPGKNTEWAGEKPELVNPAYIPDGYIFKHTQTNEDLYKHVYVKETNEEEFFTYGMQKEEPALSGTAETELDLAEGLTGQVYSISDENRILLWQDEGFYQIVEQVGDMSEIDFYKIASSILKAKGHSVLLDQYISELETAKKAEEDAQREEQEKQEEQAAMAFDEDMAVALLEKYKAVKDAAFADSYNDQSRFKSYQTKEDFYAEFTDFMSREMIESTFSFRIEERADGLYHLPMDGTEYLWPDTPYEFEKISDSEYKLTQFQEGEMNGKQNVIFYFKYTGNKWIIQDKEIIQL
jgi:hypothetical protein